MPSVVCRVQCGRIQPSWESAIVQYARGRRRAGDHQEELAEGAKSEEVQRRAHLERAEDHDPSGDDRLGELQGVSRGGERGDVRSRADDHAREHAREASQTLPPHRKRDKERPRHPDWARTAKSLYTTDLRQGQ